MVMLLDEGSDISLISREAAQKLGLILGPEIQFKYSVVGANLEGVGHITTMKVKADDRMYEIRLLAIPQLNDFSVEIPPEIFELHPHLKEAKGRVPMQRKKIQILIGYMHKALVLPTRVHRHPEEPLSHPAAVQTPVGWVIIPGLNLEKGCPGCLCRVRSLTTEAPEQTDTLTTAF